jgi:ribosomal protein L37AE/L43A
MSVSNLVCPTCSSKNVKESDRVRPTWGYNGEDLTWWECSECQLHFAQGDWWPSEHEEIQEIEEAD